MSIKPLSSQNWYIGIGLGIIFGIISMATLNSYGIDPDNPIAYFRGERIFQYFISGDRRVLNYGKDGYTVYESRNHPKFAKRHPDFYQGEISSWYDNSFGYIASAATCYLFYRILELTDPVTAHKSANTFFGMLMIMAIYWFASEAVNPIAGFFSALSMALYPRWFILVQSSVKDTPMLSLYVLTVWSGWKAVEQDNWKWLLASAAFLGMGVGSKSTAGFAFLILLVYLLTRQIRLKKYLSKSLLLAFLITPLISYLFVYMSNPMYWPKPAPQKQTNVLVKTIDSEPSPAGVSESNLFSYLLGELKRATSPNSHHSNWGPASMTGWTTIRARFAFSVTPVITIILALIGLGVCFHKFFHHQYEYYLILVVWLLIPLIRTAMPYSIAYGGIRLYADYIPPLCLLAGLGAYQTVCWSGKISFSRYVPYLILGAFLPITYHLFQLHPYESIYFNFLTGGNKGAMERHYPYTGDTHCNTYPQAIDWFNQHAGPKAGIIAANTHLLNNLGLRKDLKAVYKPEEAQNAEEVYYLTVPLSWNFEERIPWTGENRKLVKEIRVDDSPVLLIYKRISKAPLFIPNTIADDKA